MSEKKVLVTGSNGYIGSNIAKAFSNISWEVYGIDRNTTNMNARHYHKELLKADFGDYAMIKKYLENVKPDVVVHCGGSNFAQPSRENPSEYYLNNVVGTINLLRAIIETCSDKLPVVLFSSSASVYDNVDGLVTEETATNPSSPYGNTKLIIEGLLKDYYNAYGLVSISFRYFNVAGASIDLGPSTSSLHIISRVLQSAINSNEFTLNGDGHHVRDYVHVEDVADAYLKAVVNHTPKSAEVYNLGTSIGVSNQQVIEYVREHVNDFKVHNGPNREGDADQLVADASKANKTLGWTPVKSNLETIINDAWAWYKQLEVQKLENNVV